MNSKENANEDFGASLGSVAFPQQIVQLGEAMTSERDAFNPHVVTVTRWGSAFEAISAEDQGEGQRRCEKIDSPKTE